MTIFNHKLVTDGLITCFDAANTKSYPGSGTTWTDLSGNGNHGTLQGGTSFDSANLGSIDFDGVNGYVSTTTQFTDPEPFSICCWFKTPQTGRKIIGLEDAQTGTGTTGYDRMLYVRDTGKLVFGVFNSAAYTVESSGTVNGDVWTYGCGVYNQVNLNLYVNGVSQGTTASANAQNYSGYWRMGSYRLESVSWPGTTDNSYWDGKISHVSIYNIALSANQIKQNFNAIRGRYGL